MRANKRTYGSRARSRSRSVVSGAKRQRTVAFREPIPRFKSMFNSSNPARPSFQRAYLKYCDWGSTIDPAIASAGSYVFSCNGLFDPNITGAGHQPSGFDQYMALYQTYLVVGATIKVSFQSNDGTNYQTCGISVCDTPTGSTDPRIYVENGRTTWSMLDLLGTGGGFAVLTHKVDIGEFAHQTIMNDDTFSGTSSGNPSDQVYFHLWTAANATTVNSSGVYFFVEITYDCIFRDTNLASLS